jgi:predicted acyltransferase
VLLTGGISILLLAIFYLLFDVLKWQRCAFFFCAIGMNSIFIYLIVKIIDFQHVA